MGYSYASDDAPVMCFNGAKSYQTGWYSSKTTEVSAGDCFEQDLYGISDYGNSASSHVLVKLNTGSSTDYYITFNRRAGINSQTQEASNLVTITSAGGEGNSYSESTLLAKLNAGGTWSRSIDGVPMRVTVLSTPGSEYARVRIAPDGVTSCGPQPTTNPTPMPTPLPTKAPLVREWN